MPSGLFAIVSTGGMRRGGGEGNSFVHLTQFIACGSPSFVGEGDIHAQRLALPYWCCGGGVASDETFIGQMPPLSVSGMRF